MMDVMVEVRRGVWLHAEEVAAVEGGHAFAATPRPQVVICLRGGVIRTLELEYEEDPIEVAEQIVRALQSAVYSMADSVVATRKSMT